MKTSYDLIIVRLILLLITSVCFLCNALNAQTCTINAGTDDLYCLGDVYTLDGEASELNGDLTTILWTLISQPSGANVTIDDPLSEDTFFEGVVPGGNYTFQIQMSCSDGSGVATQTVTHEIVEVTEPMIADIDPVCYDGTAISISASPPGTGEVVGWAVYANNPFPVSYATPFSPTTSITVDVTGYECLLNQAPYDMRVAYRITDTLSGCIKDVVKRFDFYPAITGFYAEVPDTICGLCDDVEASCSLDGMGLWTISGPGMGTFDNPTAAQTNVCVDVFGDYTITYTVTGGCMPGTQSKLVSFESFGPTGSYEVDAGESQIFCDFADPITLNGSELFAGSTGLWTQLEGASVTFVDQGNPNTDVSGLSEAGGPYLFQWCITDGKTVCDTVSYELYPVMEHREFYSTACAADYASLIALYYVNKIPVSYIDTAAFTITLTCAPQRTLDAGGLTTNIYASSGTIGVNAVSTFLSDMKVLSDLNSPITLTTNDVELLSKYSPEEPIGLWLNGSRMPNGKQAYPGEYCFDVSFYDGCTMRTYSTTFSLSYETSDPEPNAGTDAVLDCIDTYQLSGNFIGNSFIDNQGEWSYVSGPLDPFDDDIRYLHDPVLTDLVPGSYEFRYTHYSGPNCETLSDEVTVSVAADYICNSSIVTAPSCQASDGEVMVIVSGGVSPYTYQWDDPANQTTQNAIGLEAGTYTVTITGADGCVIMCTVMLPNAESPMCTTDVINESCGLMDGVIAVNATGGSGSYTYLWDDGQTTATATNLGPGIYFVTITDSNNCMSVCSATISDVESLSCDISEGIQPSCNMSNGTAVVAATGGTEPYTYLWSNGQTSMIAIDLSSGTHDVTITDAIGCTAVCEITLSEPSGPNCTVMEVVSDNCEMHNGIASVIAEDGAAPYTYLWNDPHGQITDMAIGLGGGVYSVTVTDSNNCTSDCEVLISETAGPTCTATSIVDASCDQSIGEATVNPEGGSGDYVYAWSDLEGQNTKTAIGLDPGDYTVTVTDSNGCNTMCTVTVESTSLPLCSTMVTIEASCGNNDGAVSVLAIEGTSPYTYLWDDATGQTNAEATNLAAGNYNVTITDSIGCTTICSVTLNNSADTGPLCVISSNNLICPGADLILEESGGEAESWEWTGPNGFSSTLANPTVSPGVPGSYSVLITDANGCTSSCSIVTEEYTVPDCSIAPISTICSIDTFFLMENGIDASSWLWSSDGAAIFDDVNIQNPAITGVSNGEVFTVQISDDVGCTSECSVSVEVTECSYDLSLSKVIVSSPPYLLSNSITYEITLHNEGNIEANNIQITDTPQTGLDYQMSEATANVNEIEALLFEVVSLPPGESETISLTFEIDNAFSGTTLINNAEITLDDGDDIDSNPDSGIISDDNGDGILVNDDEASVEVTVNTSCGLPKCYSIIMSGN